MRPNIILLMCDDLGYGDTGFNGNEIINTPYLDKMSEEGARFTRFFSGGPVCSPTRGTCLTGRHYQRYGINHANQGCLPAQEITLAEVCRQHGYRAGHFGKWHLGTLTRKMLDSNRGGPDNLREYSPPWEHGFDVCFSTEAKVPTWDPMRTPDEKSGTGQRWGVPGSPFGTFYWNHKGEIVKDNLEGDDSRVIMDRTELFIRECLSEKDPFFAVVWFHAPHTPVVAGPEYRAMYSNFSESKQHYYGCITALDEQVGRLNCLLKELGIEGSTMVWFCSDNGPEGVGDFKADGRNCGSTGGLRGRKRSLFNGGIGVPAILKWPERVRAGLEFNMPCSTLDYLPTISDLIGYSMPDSRPVDGISLLPMIQGSNSKRPVPIPYRFLSSRKAMFGSPTIALIDENFKFLSNLSTDGNEDMLFDINEDMEEKRNIAAGKPDLIRKFREQLGEFINSCKKSHAGSDYPEPFSPVNDFQDFTGGWVISKK